MTASDDERLARAALTLIAEPGDEHMGRLIARQGAVGALEVVRRGGLPPDDDSGPCAWTDRDTRRPAGRLGTVGVPGTNRSVPSSAPDTNRPDAPNTPDTNRPDAPNTPDTNRADGSGERGAPAGGVSDDGVGRTSDPGRAREAPSGDTGGSRGSGRLGSAGRPEMAAERKRMAAWRNRLMIADPAKLLAACEQAGGRLVCPGDAEWPSQLNDLGDARPYAIWVLGDQDLRFCCLRSVALVGARAATGYGVHIASEMAAELADHGWSVISGGAFGIDAAAHRGALAADGLTVAVFACGVDVAYPRGNAGLFAEIGRRGLLVSEFPPGTSPTRPRFLVRNRTIAALTHGTVVVEAARRSGAISTARHARDLNRSLMVVPGPVTSAMSAGCHVLLREWAGTVCVTDAAEVLDQVGLVGDDLAPVRRGPILARDQLDPVTRNVLEAIPSRGGGTARIAVTAGVDLDTALACLGALAAGGFAERCARGWRPRRPSGT